MNIVILTDKFYPKPLANGLCVQKVAESLAIKGNKVFIIAHKDPLIINNYSHENIRVIYIKVELRLKLYYLSTNIKGKFSNILYTFASFYSKILRIFLLPFFPKTSIFMETRIYNAVKSIMRSTKVDYVISTFSPLENLQVGLKIKRLHPNVQWVLYFLDDFHFSINKTKITNIFIKRIRNLENLYYSNADKVIILKSNFSKLSNFVLSNFSNKIEISDIPLLYNSNIVYNKNINSKLRSFFENSSNINWVYAGSINRKDYDPNFLFETFLSFKDSNSRVLHLFVRGELVGFCKKVASKSNGRIIVHDYINNDELNYVLSKATILISIKNSSSISAKIFEYIQAERKIIHFSNSQSDPNIFYLTKYLNSLILEKSKSIQTEEIQVSIFEKSVRMPFNKDQLLMNFPEYTSTLILNFKGKNI